MTDNDAITTIIDLTRTGVLDWIGRRIEAVEATL